MHRFSVWSPHARSLEVEITPSPADGEATPRRQPLTSAGDGWWHADVADAGHGTDYAYRVDGGPPLPDPRSAWQPQGVHGPSRVFDAGRHAWQDGAWRGVDALGALFYELHIGTYTSEGTLDAATERLDHLVELGVDMVELLPVAAFPGVWGWGYDGVHAYAVHDPYGGPEALQRFVDACHARGLGVCLDVVYNHLGPSGNYLGSFGPYFTDKHHTPWGTAVNLDDEGSEHVRRWIVDNALRWFRDFHIDCLRLDAVHALVDDSPRHVLAQLSDEVAALSQELGRPLSLVAESDLNDPVMVEPTELGGLGMTAQWNDDFHHALHALLTGETQGYYADFGSLPVLAKTLTSVFHHDGGWSSFRGKPWGAPVDRARHSGHRFLAYLQDHDQVGNRAVGDRVSATLTSGQLAIGAALVLTSPFTPMLFMGEEWGARTPWQFFTDHQESDLAEAVRQGRRAEFAEHGWDAADVPDPQDPATRDASVLDWDEPGRDPHAALLAWHRDLVALRRQEGELRDPRLDRVAVAFDTEARWVVVRRGTLRVVANLAAEQQRIPVDGSPERTVLAWDGALLEAGSVALPGHGVAVVRIS
jgi:maltooligosyltrehalose trehalohydrolase